MSSNQVSRTITCMSCQTALLIIRLPRTASKTALRTNRSILMPSTLTFPPAWCSMRLDSIGSLNRGFHYQLSTMISAIEKATCTIFNQAYISRNKVALLISCVPACLPCQYMGMQQSVGGHNVITSSK